MSRLVIINKKLMDQKLSLADSERRTLVDLLRLVTSNNDPIYKDFLITEIYRRLNKKFYDRLSKVGNKLFSGLPDIESRIKDVLQDTFKIAFEKIDKFKWEETWSDKECEKVLLFWLSKIANNILLTECKEYKEEKEALEGYKEHIQIENSDGAIGKRNFNPPYDKGKLDEVITKLSPMAKEMLSACLEHDTLQLGNTKHLPDSVIDNLTEKYGVTPGTLRKAKERTIKKILACKLEN